MKNSYLLLLWIIIPLLPSCVTTDKISVINTEVFGPGILAVDSIATITIINRDNINLQPDTFYYYDAVKEKMVKDTLVKYKDLSNACTDALTDYLLQSGYFKAVVNYRDSMKYPVYAQSIALRQQKPDSMDHSADIYLDYIMLKDELITNSHYFDPEVIASFPEFENSTMMETVGSRLRWSIVYKNDSTAKPHRRIEDLFYGNSVNPDLFGSDENHNKLLINAAGYLSESFAKELVPYSQKASRVYYRSNNPHMLEAEKKLFSKDNIGAAEIYRKLTTNKNRNIATKASYNMALICEIEGDLDAAMDWLTRSVKSANKFDYHHFSRCDEYIALLKKRQLEIESLDKLSGE